jgi:hypothetical protein
MRGSPTESRPRARETDGTPQGSGAKRSPRPERVQGTQCPCYSVAMKDSEGEGNLRTVGAPPVTERLPSMLLGL